MKRWIHASDTIDDEYNLKQYFPKKYQKYVTEFNMEPDFDNRSGRTVHRYSAYFLDGDSVSAIGIPNFQRAVRQTIDAKLSKGDLV